MSKKTTNIFIILTVIFFGLTIVFSLKLFTMKKTENVELNGINIDKQATVISFNKKKYVDVGEMNDILDISFELTEDEINIVSEDNSKITEEMAIAITYPYYESVWWEFTEKADVFVNETEETFEITRSFNDPELNEIILQEVGEYDFEFFKKGGFAVVSKADGEILEYNKFW